MSEWKSRIQTIQTHICANIEMKTELDNTVCIVGTARTPIGSFNGKLKSITAPELGAIAIKGALAKAKIDPSLVEEVYMGNVISSNLGQAPAKQAALAAGIPTSVPCTTINKVCASGMKAINIAALSIRAGYADIVVAGGMENMSQVPYYLEAARSGYRLGNGELIDGLIKDGLWDPYENIHMGSIAEKCAEKYSISRTEQDQYCIESYQRAIQATNLKKFQDEITPVVFNTTGVVMDADEEVLKANIDKVSKLKPVFKEGGTVTAANASPITDGAAAVVLMSYKKAKELNVKIMGIIRGMGDASQDPEEFPTTPALAIPKALRDANLSQDQIDYFEINEAFSAVALANQKLLGIDSQQLNVYGGGVSIGHPLGCSGCRIVVTLLSILHQTSARYGCAAICNGGGGASAIVIEAIHD